MVRRKAIRWMRRIGIEVQDFGVGGVGEGRSWSWCLDHGVRCMVVMDALILR